MFQVVGERGEQVCVTREEHPCGAAAMIQVDNLSHGAPGSGSQGDTGEIPCAFKGERNPTSMPPERMNRSRMIARARDFGGEVVRRVACPCSPWSKRSSMRHHSA